MRFVACLFGVVFTLISLLEFLGGDFWLYRGINVLAAVAWWVTWRGTWWVTWRGTQTQHAIPEEEELLDMVEMEELQLQTV
jgi:hypothetical protein